MNLFDLAGGDNGSTYSALPLFGCVRYIFAIRVYLREGPSSRRDDVCEGVRCKFDGALPTSLSSSWGRTCSEAFRERILPGIWQVAPPFEQVKSTAAVTQFYLYLSAAGIFSQSASTWEKAPPRLKFHSRLLIAPEGPNIRRNIHIIAQRCRRYQIYRTWRYVLLLILGWPKRGSSADWNRK